MKNIQIRDIQTFLVQPDRVRLIIVKVLTTEPELYGLGCATFAWRHRAVQAYLEHHLKPFLIGKDPANIEDIWQSAMVNSYWRNGPVGNNAISGIDIALWDLKGKMAGMPCYQLWGGLSRPAAAVYVHADGKDPQAVVERAQQFKAQGFHYIRCQLGGYQGTTGLLSRKPDGVLPGAYFSAQEKLTQIPALLSMYASN